jgi:hypothetical protein
MMQIPMKVAYGDGSEVEVVAKASDLIAFERHFDRPMTELGTSRVEHILWLAWHVASKTKKTDLGFDDWVDTIDSVNLGESGE